MGRNGLPARPRDLVIQILSAATTRTDRHVKLPLYAESGVAEHWIVDPESRAVEVYTLDGNLPGGGGVFVEDQQIEMWAVSAGSHPGQWHLLKIRNRPRMDTD